MLLSDVENKIDGMMLDLINALEKEGVDRFFNHPDTIKQHLKLTDQDIEELQRESVFYCENKDWEHAIPALQWLTFFEPLHANHFVRLGCALLLTEQYEPALNVLETSLDLDRENPETTLYIGNCLRKLGNNEHAKLFFQETIDLCHGKLQYKPILHLAQQALQT